MPVEIADNISELNENYPIGSSDFISQGDDHLRLLKTAIKATFPNVADTIHVSHTVLNYLLGTTSNVQNQINARANSALFPNIANTIHASNTEINYLVGATSNIQAQINGRANTSGNNASGTWGIHISGNSVGATLANTATIASTITSQGSLATKSTINNSDWSGTDLAVTNGGTGASDASGALTNLGIANNATRTIYISTGDPTGGADGDLWYKYVA